MFRCGRFCLLRRKKPSNVLNLGSGYGFFEEMCNSRPERRFTIEGVEIGKHRLEHYVGGRVHNLDLNHDDIPKEMAGKYDLILCMHLLEHLSEPVAYLEKIQPLLAEQSEVIFEVPNKNCFLAEISPGYNDFV